MITAPVPRWQSELATSVRDAATLLRRLGLSPEQVALAPGDAGFPLRVPESYVRRMRRGDPADPLLRQVLPVPDETRSTAQELIDPVGDLDAMPVPGLLHKYHGRVLLLATGACGVHCRYCFRRHFPYAQAQGSGRHWGRALNYIRDDPEIREVILSGGDPLMLTDARLAELARALESVSHVQRLRIHSRLPVVLPSRVTTDLLEWLAGTRLRGVLVLHINHPRELAAPLQEACVRLVGSGVTLLNQSVLLRGVNDTARTLAELSEALFASRILPYYLHQLDRVRGAAHFAVADGRAREIVGELHASLPGYLVPRLVREVPGSPFKRPLCVDASGPEGARRSHDNADRMV